MNREGIIWKRLDIFKDIAERTGGDIYLGVVGAVRTGKSTFIKKIYGISSITKYRTMKQNDLEHKMNYHKVLRENNYDNRTKICSESGSNCSC